MLLPIILHLHYQLILKLFLLLLLLQHLHLLLLRLRHPLPILLCQRLRLLQHRHDLLNEGVAAAYYGEVVANKDKVVGVFLRLNVPHHLEHEHQLVVCIDTKHLLFDGLVRQVNRTEFLLIRIFYKVVYEFLNHGEPLNESVLVRVILRLANLHEAQLDGLLTHLSLF